MDEPAVPY
ncbi:unnamed protein product [Lasius platythorax]|uniref:Uncharacterized protein n=1 Tax=Lasius platythorax TaxID=488582 RepID=A0AAV2P7V5_9HYME